MAAKKRSRKQPPAPQRGLLFMDEAAALSRTSISTLRFWVQTGRMKGTVRAGKRRLVPRRVLAEALGVRVEDLV
jgi:predicted site-specific integrase-resolvase